MSDPTVRHQFVSPADAAELLGLRIDHVYKLLTRGEIRAIRVGRRYRIAQAEIDRIIEHGTRPSSQYWWEPPGGDAA